MEPGASGRRGRFRRLYAAEVDALLGFALRRSDRPRDAADVVAETFLVAWRRFDDVPSPPQARLWLYGAARRVLADQRREGEVQRTASGGRLRHEQVLPDISPP